MSAKKSTKTTNRSESATTPVESTIITLEDLRANMLEFADDGYAQFLREGLPKEVESPVLGVRIPKLKEVVKEIEKTLETPERRFATINGILRGGVKSTTSQEERIAVAFLIGRLRTSMSEKIGLVDEFIPWIDSWLVCDELAAFVKPKPSDRNELWDYLSVKAHSDAPYAVRFALVMALKYYLDRSYADATVELARNVAQNPNLVRCVKQALAWLTAEAFVKTPDKAFRLLDDEDSTFDEYAYRLAVMKGVESFRLDRDLKEELVTLLEKREGGQTALTRRLRKMIATIKSANRRKD